MTEALKILNTIIHVVESIGADGDTANWMYLQVKKAATLLEEPANITKCELCENDGNIRFEYNGVTKTYCKYCYLAQRNSQGWNNGKF